MNQQTISTSRNLRVGLLFILLLTKISTFGQAPFQGEAGIFVLGLVNQPMNTIEYSKSFVTGTAVRVSWEALEISPGVFDWDFLDGEVSNAALFNKKISISVLDHPSWLSNVGVPMYNYIDTRPRSQTFNDTLQAPITWSNEFVTRLKGLVQNLANKYANNPTVAYVNAIAGRMNNNLPSTVASGEDFWVATGYHRDTLVAKMNEMTDFYMSVFPKTPSWNSLENISFELSASGNPNNYVITQFANYGVNNYPDRFGVWREDLSACTNINTVNGHWGVVSSYPCRTGAQMVWNVQDGPVRMNQCGVATNTKDSVLTHAINNGLLINMRYYEVYKVDIDDATLVTTLQNAHNEIVGLYDICNPVLGLNENIDGDFINIFPNPTFDNFTLSLDSYSGGTVYTQLHNFHGELISSINFAGQTILYSLNDVPNGVYFISIEYNGEKIIRKIVKK